MTRLAWLLVALLASACSAPPNKEMDRAAGAIDAARAAGAERYATTEYAAATDALRAAETAVSQGDYRLALNHALESFEQAQNAARVAADTRARLRGEVERTLAEATARMAQADLRLEAARKARLPRRTLNDAADALAAARADLQEAGEAIKADDYLAARPVLQGVTTQVAETIAALDAAASQPQRRRR